MSLRENAQAALRKRGYTEDAEVTEEKTIPRGERGESGENPHEYLNQGEKSNDTEIAAAIDRLSALNSFDYDRVRKDEAKKLGIRAETLDREVRAARNGDIDDNSGLRDVEPWNDQIDPAKLLDEISGTVLRFIVCDEEVAHAVSLWVTMTWVMDAVHVAPLAVITAPEKRCGKTQLLTILGKLSYRPIAASNISSAALYRCIEAWQPTLLLDETDAFLKENEELRGVINSGHSRDNAYVIRTVGDDHTPKRFSTWSAKALSGIGTLSDTLMDRAIILKLRRKLNHENVERLRYAEPGLFVTLSRKLARFSLDFIENVRQARPSLPESLNDRAQDNWEPLLAIAHVAGGEWPERSIEAAVKLSGSEESIDENMTAGIELLKDIKEMFDEKGVDRVRTKDLIEWLCSDDEKRWSTYYRGKPIVSRQVANKLKDYGIKTNQTINFGLNKSKGYLKEFFVEAWTRYLPSDNPDLSVTIGNSVTYQYPHGSSSYRYETVTDNIGNRERKTGEDDGQTVTVSV
ncbi:DUF3631 domain-containing protein [Nitrosomonas nitrosa]|uniref:DUF3631 domain-containing protein n=1 Tax=Nitrosomonas nitrosa TaxID=52442 RepID=UPI0023F62614|nr:DUF3631 domain-containing protein [Nitrosomonas nitrosa]MCO6433475.1 DUF3631 domain-containing protein [Nitrosomonas nitrosa]